MKGMCLLHDELAPPATYTAAHVRAAPAVRRSALGCPNKLQTRPSDTCDALPTRFAVVQRKRVHFLRESYLTSNEIATGSPAPEPWANVEGQSVWYCCPSTITTSVRFPGRRTHSCTSAINRRTTMANNAICSTMIRSGVLLTPLRFGKPTTARHISPSRNINWIGKSGKEQQLVCWPRR